MSVDLSCYITSTRLLSYAFYDNYCLPSQLTISLLLQIHALPILAVQLIHPEVDPCFLLIMNQGLIHFLPLQETETQPLQWSCHVTFHQKSSKTICSLLHGKHRTPISYKVPSNLTYEKR